MEEDKGEKTIKITVKNKGEMAKIRDKGDGPVKIRDIKNPSWFTYKEQEWHPREG